MGLESRARCAGFSVTEIGNRKERLRDYASFPDRQPNVTPRNPKIAKRFKRNVNQGAKRPLILLTQVKTAAKRRWGLGMISPSGAWGGNPIVIPYSQPFLTSFPNRTQPCVNRPSGLASLSDSFFFIASRLWLVFLRISIKIPLPRHPKGIRRRQGVFFMSHSTNHPAKKWNPPAQTGAPREGNTVASATECTGLTPTEPEDLEQAYALGELSAIHTLRPQKKTGTRSAASRKPPRD